MANQQFDAAGGYLGDPITLVAAGAVQTASTNGGAVPSGPYNTLRLTLNVTAASGTTPSLTVNVQTSGDNSTWATVASFTAATTTGVQRKVFNGLDRYVRATTTITGTTPSFTFGVVGDAI